MGTAIAFGEFAGYEERALLASAFAGGRPAEWEKDAGRETTAISTGAAAGSGILYRSEHLMRRYVQGSALNQS